MIDMTTVSFEARVILAFLNFVLCTGIGYSCICRFSAMSGATTLPRFRLAYVLLFLAASASGFSWAMFKEWPGPGQISLAIACLAFLGVGYRNWRHGPPPHARTAPAELDSQPHDHWPDPGRKDRS